MSDEMSDKAHLGLGSVTRTTVYVRYVDDTLQFSKDNEAFKTTKEIKWAPATNSPPLTLTFMFGDGVANVTPVSGNDNFTLVGVIYNVSTNGGQDHFTIQKTTGDTEDPKIVVTPQT